MTHCLLANIGVTSKRVNVKALAARSKAKFDCKMGGVLAAVDAVSAGAAAEWDESNVSDVEAVAMPSRVATYNVQELPSEEVEMVKMIKENNLVVIVHRVAEPHHARRFQKLAPFLFRIQTLERSRAEGQQTGPHPCLCTTRCWIEISENTNSSSQRNMVIQ